MNGSALPGWDRLRHGGLLLDAQRLQDVAQLEPPPLTPHLEQELRRAAAAAAAGDGDPGSFVAFVLDKICGFAAGQGVWLRVPNVGAEWSRRTPAGESVRPRHLWRGAHGALLPVFFDGERQLGVGRGRRAASQVVQWLRAGTERLALLTNGRQWRLIFAGLDFDAWCEWDVDLWFEEGELSPQVRALRTLLSPRAWTPPAPDQPPPLLAAVLASRKGQSELSAALGERVREAVELLVQAHGEVLRERCADVAPADIYRAAVRVVMRLVVVLFAESRDLLPRDNALYHAAYGIGGLIDELEKAAARGGNQLARSWSAWPRLLALFRLVHQGSHHPALPVPAYGGELFEPAKEGATDGLSRALHVFETAAFDPNRSVFSDREVRGVLERVSRTRTRLRQGRASTCAINTFVCTPTLELGVDIGQLDAVLMRNVPPLPANYWQRAGRAGRRHRMAVDVTYCRPVSHDRAYFADPPKLLAGRVDPPAFNLRNELMVAKHVHATVITRLHQYTRDPARSPDERAAIDGVLRTCLPERVSSYLFDGGVLRTTAFDLSPLRRLIESNRDDLYRYVEGAFRQGWPAKDADVTTPEALRRHVDEMVTGLEQVLSRLNRRLRWAMEQIRRLNAVREQQGTLEPEDDGLFRRCDALVKRLKGTVHRARREAEGYDDVNTFGVLAAEGFLPGYGLEVGSVLGTAEIPFWRTGAMEFTLPRPPSVALREYVPGNLIYANGNRFVARRFHRDADEQTAEVPTFEVATERQAVKPTNLGATATGLGTTVIQAISVCDVDLVHQSHISDEEEVRFQLGVAVFGLEREQHNGGRAFRWGEQPVQLRRGVRLRLVNVGASSAIERFGRFGYPVCTVCGQSVSPLSSDRQHEQFEQSHKDRCGREVRPLGFYADVVADTLSLPGCPDQKTAYSVLEALRFAATRVLDMTMDDLQVLVLGHVDRDDVDASLWDPIPGGSGLLDQICERFDEIVAVATEVVNDCPSACEASCIDCLQTFRNGFYHKHLDRKLAAQKLAAWGARLAFAHDIPARQPSPAPTEGTYPVNEAERRLRHLLLAAGFEEGTRGEEIPLDRAIGTTTPDVIYRAPHHGQDEGVCIYLDGLSGHLHGNPATAERDARIRSWLRNNGYDVIEIAVSDLYDVAAMTRHFRRLAGYLNAPDLRERIRADTSWFDTPRATETAKERVVLRLVRPTRAERYVKCVPLVPLKAAAGAFGDPQTVRDEPDWENWVAVETGRKLRPGMFVAQVVGRSMEPAIPDGSYCLFAAPVQGTRQGKNVLVQLRDAADPETGERYTVKRYESEKAIGEDGTWRHLKVTLKPLNPQYQPIVLTVEDEGTVQVIAELVDVLV